MRAALAIAASVGVHVLLAAALAVYLAHAPEPEALASLDLSSVELSFAEEDADSAVVAPLPPSPPAEAAPHPETRPPDPPRADVRPLPPDPDSLGVKPPDSEVLPMEEVRREEREKPAEPLPEPTAAPQPQVAPRQARIDAPPRPKKTIRPHYPDGARQRGEQGDVVLEIRVDGDGSVGDVNVVSSSGFGELDAAAVRAVRAARFTPAKSGGSAVASTARLTLTFRLRN